MKYLGDNCKYCLCSKCKWLPSCGTMEGNTEQYCECDCIGEGSTTNDCSEFERGQILMLTERQRMQIKRSIGYKHGFLPETVDLTNINNIKKNVVIDGGRIEIEVEFSHPTGYWGSEIFLINPSDKRAMPFRKRSENEL